MKVIRQSIHKKEQFKNCSFLVERGENMKKTKILYPNLEFEKIKKRRYL